jgi:tetratricopeptide (TPR) repeat protein
MPAEAGVLKGKRVAFTGKLASMTRAEAKALVRANGGIFVSSLSRRTSVLVVGQDGWPLQKDGRLTSKLRRAHVFARAGQRIAVLSEEDFLSLLGLESHVEEVRRLYSTAQLSSLLKIPGDRVRRWLTAGLIRAVETVDSVNYFDYAQVVSARTLSDLTQAGVGCDRLRHSIQQLQTWLKNVEEPLVQLALMEQNGELLVRLKDGLADPTGQRRLDFGDVVDDTVSLPQPEITAVQWFELGCEHEDAGRLSDAAEAYRQALAVDESSAVACFNLANCLYALGKKERAVERYSQAAEMDVSFAEAWNNLGVVLLELGSAGEAATAFERALEANPAYADAHYNLADLFEETGDSVRAAAHWRAYLAQDRQSRWASHARKRLAVIGC